MKNNNKKKIAIIANTSWYLFNFRKNLLQKLVNSGYEVIAVAPYDEFSQKLKTLGCIYEHIYIDSKSKNPINDISITINFLRIFIKKKPAVILNFTAKPNIYATLAGRTLGIPAVNNIAGLGSGFVEESMTTKILRILYRYSQKKASKVFFQNEDDFQEFLFHKMVFPEKTTILPGSGVDLQHFSHHTLPVITREKKFTFLLISRILYSKGIELLFYAAKKIYDERNYDFRVQVVGQVGVNNSDAIPLSKIEEWNNEPFFEYLGKTEDIRQYITQSHCVILPSFYREGTPKSILEGLAIGRPIITTDMPGCRTTIVKGQNGFLIKPRDVNDLEQSMRKMISCDYAQLQEMGSKSRQLAEQKFDEQIVIKQYLKTINSILN
ncbi:glycosyltransferase family 4 protein [Salinimicrobium flavum]|uniref:Glycosyltransferase family 4 protein n=1 Tax=Salinimicrobium flavum TaxID=1737065 RepID=A0ABW5ITY4_9FLAO